MTDKRVIVTYCDEAQIWSHISDELYRRLPLRNMTWQGLPSRTSPNIPPTPSPILLQLQHQHQNLPATATTTTNITTTNLLSTINTASPLLSISSPNITGLNIPNYSNDASKGFGFIDKSSKSIDTLDIHFKKFTPDIFPKEGPITLNPSTIFCHIYLVSCDDNELYKTSVKKQLQDWVNLLSSKRNQEWLIIYLPSPSGKRSSRFLNVGASSVFDKIKADFHTQKKERVAQLRLFSPGLSEIEIWGDFFSALKESILSGFTMHLSQREEDTKRLEAQRHLPGWNYNQYFIMKETVATMYEVMNIYDASLQCYDELEALFTLMQSEQGAPWFKSFGATDTGDDAEDVLNLKRKPYRDLILQTNCTIFDFRCYLFGKQCQTLVRLKNPTEICHRAKRFVTTFARTLREYNLSLMPHFCEAWVYSTCIHIVSHCEELLAVSTTLYHTLPDVSYEAAKAELLHHARIQLDTLGGLRGLIPLIPALSRNHREAKSGDIPLSSFTNDELKNALQDQELFDQLYLNLTDRAVKSFVLSRRFRQSIMLRNDAANLYFHRKRYLQAAREWESIIFKYTDEGWTTIDMVLTEKLIKCQQEIGEKKGLIQSCLHILSHPGNFTNDKLCAFLDLLHSVSTDIESSVTRESDALFRLNVLGIIFKIGEEDGFNVELSINSILPKEVTIDEISLSMVGGELNEDVVLKKSTTVIKPGANIVKVSSEKTCVPGSYAVENIKLERGQITFSYNMLKHNKKHVFRIFEQATSLHVSVTLPDQLVYGESISTLQVRVYARHSGIQSGSILLSSLSNLTLLAPKSVNFRVSSSLVSKAKDPIREITIETMDSLIQIPSCQENEIIEFQVPFTTSEPSELNSAVEHRANEAAHLIKIAMSYKTCNGRKRIYSAVERVMLCIPFLIGHDILESEKGFVIQVSMANNQKNPTRIFQSQMLVPKMFRLTEFVCESDQTLFQDQKYAFLYQLLQQSDDFNLSGNTDISCQFLIQYYGLQEEVEMYIITKLEEHLLQNSSVQYMGFLTQFLRDGVIRNLDYINYAINETILFGEYDKAALNAFLGFEEVKVREKLLDLMAEFYEAYKMIDMAKIRQAVKIFPRTIAYNVVLPIHPILLIADLRLENSNQGDYLIGDIIRCNLNIEEVRWSANEAKSVNILCEAIIQNELWMVSGKKKQVLTLMRGESKKVPVCFVPLKTGMLPLPTFQITLLCCDEIITRNSNNGVSIAQIYFLGCRQVSVIPHSCSAQIFVSDDLNVCSSSVL